MQNQVLFVSENSQRKMKQQNYPTGIRILFDPQAEVELAEEIEAEKLRWETRMKKVREIYGDELPF